MKTHHPDPVPDDGKTALDPVCGMRVNPSTTPHRLSHAGQDFHFCSAKCRERFAAEPVKFLMPVDAPPVAAAPAGTIYTCPMHTQIRQEGPGTCPI